MRQIKISDKLWIVRHWGKWYRVMRGFTDWQPIEIKKRPGSSKDTSIEAIADNIQKELNKKKKSVTI